MRSITGRRNVLLGSLAALASATLAACGSGDRLTAVSGRSQAAAVPGGTLGLGIVGLIVKDLPASLVFYRRLGLAIPDDVDTTGGAFRLRLPNGMVFWWETVEYTQAGFDTAYRPTGTGDGDRKTTLEFGFSKPDEVNAMYDTLLAAGAKGYYGPVSWYNGDIRFAMVVDPDGNKIGLRWPLAS